MNVYLISQTVNDDYDTFDSAVVAAETMEDAAMIHPLYSDWDGTGKAYDSWCACADVNVELIGETNREKGVICASFNAG